MPNDLNKAEMIRSRLVVDEQEVFESHLERVERLILLDASGKVHFKVPRDKLTQRQILALYLVGKKFAEMGGLVDRSYASIEDISDALGFSHNVASARASELGKRGFVEGAGRGKWQVRYAVVDKILTQIEKAIQGMK